jgi:hypothetical protein
MRGMVILCQMMVSSKLTMDVEGGEMGVEGVVVEVVVETVIEVGSVSHVRLSTPGMRAVFVKRMYPRTRISNKTCWTMPPIQSNKDGLVNDELRTIKAVHSLK